MHLSARMLSFVFETRLVSWLWQDNHMTRIKNDTPSTASNALFMSHRDDVSGVAGGTDMTMGEIFTYIKLEVPAI